MAAYDRDPVNVPLADAAALLEDGLSGGGLVTLFVRADGDPGFMQLRARSDAAVAWLAEAIGNKCDVPCAPSRLRLFVSPNLAQPLDSTASLLAAGVRDGDRVIAVPAEAPKRAAGATMTAQTVGAGVGFGTALAITISYSTHKSILWAVVHGFCGWLYVLYAAATQR
jgi:hypothetical protein